MNLMVRTPLVLSYSCRFRQGQLPFQTENQQCSKPTQHHRNLGSANLTPPTPIPLSIEDSKKSVIGRNVVETSSRAGSYEDDGNSSWGNAKYLCSGRQTYG
jgi:hypothetical protein